MLYNFACFKKRINSFFFLSTAWFSWILTFFYAKWFCVLLSGRFVINYIYINISFNKCIWKVYAGRFLNINYFYFCWCNFYIIQTYSDIYKNKMWSFRIEGRSTFSLLDVVCVLVSYALCIVFHIFSYMYVHKYI